jgi:chromosome segregation ATPase
VFNHSVPGSGGSAPRMLTAAEKIAELEASLARVAGDCDAQAQELEEVRAEKVSLEYLLREKLEKMVAAEVRERMDKLRAGESARDRELAEARETITRLEAETTQLRATARTAAHPLEDYRARLSESADRIRALTQEVQVLRERESLALEARGALEENEVFAKERNAIKVILERKMKVLIDAIMANPNVGGMREVTTLHRLVNSTIAALEHQ